MIFKINLESDEALYQQVVNQIIVGIASDEIREGDALPSVRSLAEDIGINMHTVNKAYSLLRQEGFVTMDYRRGTVVKIQKDRQNALKDMKNSLRITLAKGRSRRISRGEIHELVDEIFDEYELMPEE